MQLYKRILKISGIILLIVLFAAVLAVRHIATRSLPDYNRDIILEGLSAEVTVTRDGSGVPSVYAQQERDLYLAVGYVMAQDRLWQMDLLRRAAEGKLSEVFGEEFVEADLLVRSLRLPEKSAAVLSRSDKEVVYALEAFACGVNQFIRNNRNRLPPEFAILGYSPGEWKPLHSVNLMGYLAWEAGGEWSTLIILERLRQRVDEKRFNELVPRLDLHRSFVHPRVGATGTRMNSGLLDPGARSPGTGVFSGSNSWVVSGSRSVTGKPLFAHDMHLFFMAPGTWYQMHQAVDGRLNVTGVVLPGQPLVISGHNEDIAWGMTSAMVDDVDFYSETINPENPLQYRFNGEWRDMEVRTELIKTGKNSSVEKVLRFTHRGPVISDCHDPGEGTVSIRWIGNEYSNELQGTYYLNRAGNWKEFREAVSNFISISQNITYADTRGNIGIQTAAGIPLRKGASEFVVPGDDISYEWQGIVPFSELPYTFNPPEGYVIAANNRTVPDDYPYYIGHWFDTPNRYDRIREMIDVDRLLSAADFTVMLCDKKSVLARRMIPSLLGELDKMEQLSPGQLFSIDMLRDWNYVYEPGEAAPVIFEKFYMKFLENLLLEEMGRDLYELFLSDKILVRNLMELVWEKRRSAWLSGDCSEDAEAFTGIVHGSFGETVKWLENKMGADPRKWTWAGVHQLQLEHPMGRVRLLDALFNLNRGPWSPGGSFHTVGPFSYDFLDPFTIIHGASHRHVYQVAEWDGSFSVVPGGISGIPASDHYSDQAELFMSGSYRPDLFSLAAVGKNGKYRMSFMPAVLTAE